MSRQHSATLVGSLQSFVHLVAAFFSRAKTASILATMLYVAGYFLTFAQVREEKNK